MEACALSWRQFKHFGDGSPKLLGQIVMAGQPEGLRVRVKTRVYLDPDMLSQTLGFWFWSYGLTITEQGHILLLIPKKEKYGVVLGKLAEALYKIQKGDSPANLGQSRLISEGF